MPYLIHLWPFLNFSNIKNIGPSFLKNIHFYHFSDPMTLCQMVQKLKTICHFITPNVQFRIPRSFECINVFLWIAWFLLRIPNSECFWKFAHPKIHFFPFFRLRMSNSELRGKSSFLTKTSDFVLNLPINFVRIPNSELFPTFSLYRKRKILPSIFFRFRNFILALRPRNSEFGVFSFNFSII